MYQFKELALVDSRSSSYTHGEYDEEYDVYLFWPSGNPSDSSESDDFVHVRVPYGNPFPSDLSSPETPISSISSTHKSIPTRGEAHTTWFSKKPFISNFFSSMYRTLHHMIHTIRTKLKRRQSDSAC